MATATAKKTTKKAPTNGGKASPGRPTRFLGKQHLATLRLLKKTPRGLTRNQISEKLGITSGFTSLLGHLEPEKRETGSLAYRGFIRFQEDPETGATIALITAAGSKAIETAEKEEKERAKNGK